MTWRAMGLADIAITRHVVGCHLTHQTRCEKRVDGIRAMSVVDIDIARHHTRRIPCKSINEVQNACRGVACNICQALPCGGQLAVGEHGSAHLGHDVGAGAGQRGGAGGAGGAAGQAQGLTPLPFSTSTSLELSTFEALGTCHTSGTHAVLNTGEVSSRA